MRLVAWARRGKLGGLIAVALALALPLVTMPAPNAGATTRRAGGVPSCPISALQKAKRPVQITFWHGLNRANEQALQSLTDQFNSSQSQVHVSLVNQTSYDDTFNKYAAGLASGDLPDLVQIEDTRLQEMIDSRSILPVASCVKADKYSSQLSDFLPRVVQYWTVKGVLYAMPFNISNPVLLYNKKAFTKAGLDPNTPPKTLDEVVADAEKLKTSGAVSQAGFGLKTNPWFIEQLLAKAGVPYVNNGNGRNSRATRAVFDNATAEQTFSWMTSMVKRGLATVNSDQGTNEFDNLLGIGNGSFGMTIDSSGTLGTITQLLAGGNYPNVDLGVAPMPGPVGKGGVLVGGAAIYLSAKSAPEKQAAAWAYLKFLDSPQSQATFAAASGYVPVRRTSTGLPAIQDLWARIPGYKVAYDQLVTGVANVATAGPVIGDYAGVRNAVRNAQASMFSSGTSPKSALAAALQAANAAIAHYNDRVR
jgi:sn-glycerol 3-phosphate transport system substrate-binding protein